MASAQGRSFLAPVGASGEEAQGEDESDDEYDPEAVQRELDEWDEIIASLSDDEQESDIELPPQGEEAAEEAPQAGEGVPPPPPVDSRFERQRRPRAPDAEAVARHNVCHWPYQSWCPICVRARGREDQHKVEQKRLEEVESNPVIGFDYKPLGPRTLIIGKTKRRTR